MNEFDKAIADLNEAMRLEPGLSTDYVCRGYAWRCKKEYDKAIDDYNETIRLDPLDAEAYTCRGDRLARKEGARQGHRRLHGGHPASIR